MLISTVELRWFFAETLPASAVNWFCAGGHWIREEPRTDRYLVLPGCDYVGVKIRQGRIEVKAQRGVIRPVTYTGVVTGRSEAWIKWSSAHPAPPGWIGTITSREDQWIDVGKERWLRRFAVSAKGVRELERAQPMRRDGCNVELTRLTLRGEPWWSLSLEAFGNQSGLEDLLDRIGAEFFGQNQPSRPLTEADSFAYPTWLTRSGAGRG